MKLHKLISRTVLATALLGTTIGGAFVGINASADKTINQGAVGQDDAGNNTTGGTNVVNNGLALDSVPDFNFQDQNSDNSNKLSLQQSGKLSVSDYRSQDKSGHGWSLKVTANPIDTDSNNNNDWYLALNKTSPDSDVSSKAIPSSTHINQLNLKTNDNSSNAQNLVSNGQYGLTKATYSDSDATLTVPNVAPSYYSTSINWTLYTSTNGNNDN